LERLISIQNITPLHLAAMYRRFDVLEMMIHRGAFIDAQDDQRHTALHYGAMNNHGDMCRFLIRSGCDHTLPDIQGKKGAKVAPKPLKKEFIDFIL
jgi:ankyrin repeat protein